MEFHAEILEHSAIELSVIISNDDMGESESVDDRLLKKFLTLLSMIYAKNSAITYLVK